MDVHFFTALDQAGNEYEGWVYFITQTRTSDENEMYMAIPDFIKDSENSTFEIIRNGNQDVKVILSGDTPRSLAKINLHLREI